MACLMSLLVSAGWGRIPDLTARVGILWSIKQASRCSAALLSGESLFLKEMWAADWLSEEKRTVSCKELIVDP